MPDSTIHRFLSQKESWILEHLSHADLDRQGFPAAADNAVGKGMGYHKKLLLVNAEIYIQKKSRSLRQKNGRNLRPYHDPGTKNPLEKLISYTVGRDVVTAADIQAVTTSLPTV